MSDKTLTYTIFFAPRDFGDVRCRQNSAGRKITIGCLFGALLGCGRRPRFASLLDSLLPFRLSTTRAISIPIAARPRTNAVTLDAVPRLRFRRFLFGRVAARAAPPRYHCGALSSLSIPTGFALPAVALAPPRKPSPTRAEWGSLLSAADFRRNWQHTLARRQKKKPIRLVRALCQRLFITCNSV